MASANEKVQSSTGWKWRMVERKVWLPRGQSSIGWRIQFREEEKDKATQCSRG
jgi:hypothetical protein